MQKVSVARKHFSWIRVKFNEGIFYGNSFIKLAFKTPTYKELD
jgi:hypothetical protein